jgi:hypothetical protein
MDRMIVLRLLAMNISSRRHDELSAEGLPCHPGRRRAAYPSTAYQTENRARRSALRPVMAGLDDEVAVISSGAHYAGRGGDQDR